MGQRSSLTSLSLQPEETPAVRDRRAEAGGRRGLLILLLLVLLAGAGGGGYVLLRRLQGLEQQVTRLAETMGETASLARQAADRAAAAEAAALRAAEGRQAAETQTAAARQDAEAARAQADAARQEAAGAQEVAARAQAQAQEVRARAQAEIDRLHEALGSIAETRSTALGLVMNLGSDRLKFDFDKAELRTGDRELLSRIAGILLTTKDTSISIAGHTDDVGTDAYNHKLSLRRAEAVRDYLVQAGLPAADLDVTGHGKSIPLVPGTSEAARAKNRRVELGIAYARFLPQGPGSTTP